MTSCSLSTFCTSLVRVIIVFDFRHAFLQEKSSKKNNDIQSNTTEVHDSAMIVTWDHLYQSKPGWRSANQSEPGRRSANQSEPGRRSANQSEPGWLLGTNRSLADVPGTNRSLTDVLRTNGSLADVLRTNRSLADVPGTNRSLADVLRTNRSLVDVLRTNRRLADVLRLSTCGTDMQWLKYNKVRKLQVIVHSRARGTREAACCWRSWGSPQSSPGWKPCPSCAHAHTAAAPAAGRSCPWFSPCALERSCVLPLTLTGPMERSRSRKVKGPGSCKWYHYYVAAFIH